MVSSWVDDASILIDHVLTRPHANLKVFLSSEAS